MLSVTTLYTLEVPDIMGPAIRSPIGDLSSLAENLILLRFVELRQPDDTPFARSPVVSDFGRSSNSPCIRADEPARVATSEFCGATDIAWRGWRGGGGSAARLPPSTSGTGERALSARCSWHPG